MTNECEKWGQFRRPYLCCGAPGVENHLVGNCSLQRFLQTSTPARKRILSFRVPITAQRLGVLTAIYTFGDRVCYQGATQGPLNSIIAFQALANVGHLVEHICFHAETLTRPPCQHRSK